MIGDVGVIPQKRLGNLKSHPEYYTLLTTLEQVSPSSLISGYKLTCIDT